MNFLFRHRHEDLSILHPHPAFLGTTKAKQQQASLSECRSVAAKWCTDTRPFADSQGLFRAKMAVSVAEVSLSPPTHNAPFHALPPNGSRTDWSIGGARLSLGRGTS